MKTDTSTIHSVVPRVLARRPRIRVMTRRQIDCVLARNHVARVAFQHEGRVHLYPVHYVYADGVLFGRTSFGFKATTWHHRPEVVMEVDEVEQLFAWRSVVIRGNVSLLRPRGTPADRAEYLRVAGILRSLVPDTLTERDPTPERTVIFRVDPSALTGRDAGR
jgi:nitroimidazol reductase NimA-like FMN-containing flavoprotein (pyridoxamine 5'-phosphate oxidase superfamily)